MLIIEKDFFFLDKQVLKWKFMQFYKIIRRRPKKKNSHKKLDTAFL